MRTGDTFNPFRGPQPYGSQDRERFFGREEATRRLVNRIVAHSCITFYGPSGAGKSSLMRAGVIPMLEEMHGFRTVRVEGWFAGEPPLERLFRAVIEDLNLDLELSPPSESTPLQALELAMEMADRHSDRPILFYLDHLEQCFLPGLAPEQTRAFLEGLEALASRPALVHLVLSVREDYLGRLRDWLRGKRELLEQSFRLGPLTVGEMVRVACQLALTGSPAQQWSEAQVRELMLQVRLAGQEATDEAEVQSAFAQIVCRALWEERVPGGKFAGPVAAEPILHRYLDATLEGLGPVRGEALRLLEDYLVASDGSRALLTESQAHAVLSPGIAERVLAQLEAAAVLRAEHHQGSRYFELGHDWLARKVFELKQERGLLEARQRELQRAGKLRRRLVGLTVTALAVSLLMGVLLVVALRARERVRELALMAGARELHARGQPAMAAKLLLEVHKPKETEGWDELSREVLRAGVPELTLYGPQRILTAALSPDGRRVVTASKDGTVRVWSIEGRREPVVLQGHSDEVTSASFSSDGQRVVTASKDGTARVWRADGTGEPLVLRWHEGAVSSAEFSPDGQRVVTTSWVTVRVWRMDETGMPVVLWRDDRWNLSARFSPDGQKVVMTSWDKIAQVRRADGTGMPVVLRGHEGPVLSAAFSPEGQWVVTASEDGTARVWRADGTGEPVVLRGHEGEVSSAEFSPDGQRVVTTSRDRTVRLWRVDGTGEPVVLGGHEGPVSSARFSPDGQRVVTASEDRTARVWRVNGTGEPVVLRGHEGVVSSAEFSPDGQRVVTTSLDGRVRLWRAEGTGLFVALLRHERPVRSAGFSPDGQWVVTASEDGRVRVWRADGTELPVVLRGHEGRVSSAAFSPDGQRVVTGSWDGTARVGRTDGMGTPVVLQGHEGPVSSAAFSPDGRLVVTASADKTARVWRADGTGTPVVLQGHEGGVSSAAFSPDGRLVVTASADKTARVWRADGTGTPVLLQGHEGGVSSAAFSPDGRLVVTASADKTARVWRADGTGAPVVLRGHADVLSSAGFSPDGQWVVTASEDGTARVWRRDGTGTPVVFREHVGPVQSAEFSPDGGWVATASMDGTARVWRFDLLDLRPSLQMINKDCLLPELRRRYLGESEERAWSTYERCEHSYGRVPFLTRSP